MEYDRNDSILAMESTSTILPFLKKLFPWIWLFPLLLIPVGEWLLPTPRAAYHWMGWIWLLTSLASLIGLNQLIHQRLNRRLPWQDSPQRRFFSQLLLSLGSSLLLLNLSYFLFQKLGMNTSPTADQYYVMNVYSLIFLLPLISAQVVSYLFALWKKSTLISEKLEQENIQTRLESLRSHLDPHFLFNSLNILSSLIDKSPDDAQDFLASFSDVYRYVLQHKNEALVPLRTEWNFLEAYLHLIRVRFRDQLKVEIDTPTDMNRWMIPPLAMQMLVENAIKHNKASESQPLVIEIISNNTQVVVRNNRRPNPRPAHSHGSGLNNLRSRYSYLTPLAVEILENDDTFEVRLPLIERSES